MFACMGLLLDLLNPTLAPLPVFASWLKQVAVSRPGDDGGIGSQEVVSRCVMRVDYRVL